MKYQCLLFVICSVLINVDSIMSNATQPCETPQYVQLGTKGIVHCNFSDDFFGVYWYNSTDYVNEFSLINIKNSENPKTGPGFETGEFDVFHNGSLIIQKVNFGHAHTYTVVKLDSPTDVIIPHYVDVIVTALPTPPYPVIEGCDTQQACVMEVGNQGNLTCSVEGIVPNVTLEWRGVQEDSSVVFIPNQQNTTRRTDGRYNVFLTSSFYINRKLGHSVNVECTVTVHKEGPKFDLRSPVVLVFADDTTQQTAPTKGNAGTSAAVVVIPVVAVVLVFVTAVITYVFIKGRTNSRGLDTEPEFATRIGRFLQGSEDSESEQEPLLDISEVTTLKQLLREKYMDVFGGIVVVSTSQHKSEPQEIPNLIETEDEIHTTPTGNVEDTVSGNRSTINQETEDDSTSIEQENSKIMEEKDRNDARTFWEMGEIGKSNIGDTEASSAVNVTATTFPDQTSFAEDRFVLEPVVQMLTLNPGSGTKGIWKNYTSITEILKDSDIESKSFIVEGEFDHEISSISKILAREWSMEEESSLASEFDILIVLKLSQIRADKTVCSEVRRLLLSCDTSLRDGQIQRILQKHDKVAFVLDGFNTYVDWECNTNCEVTQIIKTEFLTNCTIILTTSPSCVPNDSKQKFTRLRAKDLSANDQDFLISRKVSIKDTSSGDKIKSLLRENFLLRDILQIPLFFDMFLKMSSQMIKFECITVFFVSILSGFYMNSPGERKQHDVELWDAKLGKLAFEALEAKRGKDKTWSKEEICSSLGEDAYNFYYKMEVLKQEEVSHLGIKPLQTESTIVVSDTKVKFAHPLFYEWYVAQYLSTTMKTNDKQYKEGELISLLSDDCWYCLRFLCGINDRISDEICKEVEPKVLQILCQLEAQESLQNITEAVKSWCSKEVFIEPEHTKAQQMATVQLLEFGSKKEVSHLTLKNCFNSVEGASEFLELRSGVQLPVLKNLKRLDVIEEGRELTNSEVAGIINFALRCSKLEDVKFFQCLLPKTLDGINIAGNSKFKGVKVEWNPDTESSHVYPLGHKKFTWKRQKGEDLDDTMYRGLIEVFRDKHGIKIQE